LKKKGRKKPRKHKTKRSPFVKGRGEGRAKKSVKPNKRRKQTGTKPSQQKKEKNRDRGGLKAALGGKKKRAPERNWWGGVWGGGESNGGLKKVRLLKPATMDSFVKTRDPQPRKTSI